MAGTAQPRPLAARCSRARRRTSSPSVLFDVASQLNRGAGRLIDRDEKAQGRPARRALVGVAARAIWRRCPLHDCSMGRAVAPSQRRPTDLAMAGRRVAGTSAHVSIEGAARMPSRNVRSQQNSDARKIVFCRVVVAPNPSSRLSFHSLAAGVNAAVAGASVDIAA